MINGDGLETVSIVGAQVAERIHQVEKVTLAVGENATQVGCWWHAGSAAAAEASKKLRCMSADCNRVDGERMG